MMKPHCDKALNMAVTSRNILHCLYKNTLFHAIYGMRRLHFGKMMLPKTMHTSLVKYNRYSRPIGSYYSVPTANCLVVNWILVWAYLSTGRSDVLNVLSDCKVRDVNKWCVLLMLQRFGTESIAYPLQVCRHLAKKAVWWQITSNMCHKTCQKLGVRCEVPIDLLKQRDRFIYKYPDAIVRQVIGFIIIRLCFDERFLPKITSVATLAQLEVEHTKDARVRNKQRDSLILERIIKANLYEIITKNKKSFLFREAKKGEKTNGKCTSDAKRVSTYRAEWREQCQMKVRKTLISTDNFKGCVAHACT